MSKLCHIQPGETILKNFQNKLDHPFKAICKLLAEMTFSSVLAKVIISEEIIAIPLIVFLSINRCKALL